MSAVTHVMVASKCPECTDGKWRDPSSGTWRFCERCKGSTLAERLIPIEDFAKLFTYGQTYTVAAMRGQEAPDNEIRVRSAQHKGPDTTGSTDK